jgi:hypothetical protein
MAGIDAPEMKNETLPTFTSERALVMIFYAASFYQKYFTHHTKYCKYSRSSVSPFWT